MFPRRLATACTVTLLLALTACSGGGDDVNLGGDTGSATAGSSESAPAASLTKDNVAEAIRAAQAAAGSAHVEATVEAVGQTLELTGDVADLDTPETPTFDFSAEAGTDRTFRLVVVEGTLYVKGGGIDASNGKPWLRSDVSDPDNPIAQVFQAANPGNFASYLNGVTAFEDHGSETVDGVQTQHYTVTVDTERMLAANPVFRGQSVAQLGLPQKLTSEVYVDEQNRPIEIAVDLAAAGAFEVHFSDYGKKVTVQPPPPDEVGTLDLGD